MIIIITTSCVHPPLQVDLLTLKVVSESRVTWATSVPIFVFLGFSVLDLGPMYVTDRQTDAKRQTYIRRASSLNVPYPRGRGIITSIPEVKVYLHGAEKPAQIGTAW